MLAYLAAGVLGYLLGCSNMALYLSKAKGVDLRAAGSGNLGASNAMILMGWGAGIAVGVHDIGKSVLAVVLVRWLFPQTDLAVALTAGVGCVLGHMYPFYLGFSGGKGLASYIGMVAVLNWRVGIAVVLSIAILTLITDYIAVGTIVTVIAYPVFVFLLMHSWLPVLILCVAGAAMLYKHRGNCVRIYQGVEIGLRQSGRGQKRLA
jgi:glycerol-3-phosphate acyltransferase PlsY